MLLLLLLLLIIVIIVIIVIITIIISVIIIIIIIIIYICIYIYICMVSMICCEYVVTSTPINKHLGGCLIGGYCTISVAIYHYLGEPPKLINQGLLIRG